MAKGQSNRIHEFIWNMADDVPRDIQVHGKHGTQSGLTGRMVQEAEASCHGD